MSEETRFTIGEAADEAWIKSLRANIANKDIEIAVMKDALDFILSLAEEEYEYCAVGTGAEVALRHIIRKAREAIAKATRKGSGA